ncbi:Poly(A) polymerase [Achlya hypogyna]|uniref:Poly(A) polymerase n=1 Tax=Achlya hypogyna TaxID=1202772 RepID=A0A1V9ZTJ9_ACHHY|nr:Poly(A) polymerase [Achlya hypogyna]
MTDKMQQDAPLPVADEFLLEEDDIFTAMQAMDDEAEPHEDGDAFQAAVAWMDKMSARGNTEHRDEAPEDVLLRVMDDRTKHNLLRPLPKRMHDLAWLRPMDPIFARSLLSRSQGMGDSQTLTSGPHVWFVKRGMEFVDVLRVLLKVPTDVTVELHEETTFRALDLTVQLTEWLWALTPTKLSTLVHGEVVETTAELVLAMCSGRNWVRLQQWSGGLDRFQETNPRGHDVTKLARLLDDARQLMVLVAQEHVPFQATLQVPRLCADKLGALDTSILNYYNHTHVDVGDEARRRDVVAGLEKVVKQRFDRKCELHLYGSSLSLFGSKGCDIDISVVRKGSDPAMGQQGVGAARRHYDDVLAAAGLSTRCAEALEQLVGEEAKAKAAYDKMLARCPADRKKTPAKIATQLKQAIAFYRAWHGLVLMAQRVAGAGGSSTPDDVVTAKKAIRAAIGDIEVQRKSMYRLSAAITQAGCTVQQMILGARVPIIKFKHLASGLEGDICLGNTLPTKNTLLLRTYGDLDPRVRPLVLAVKHWAKARLINDASMGTLSSYSYVLLVIHVLQQAGVLPNLQDPALLEQLRVPPQELNGCNVAFCHDVARVQAVARLPDTRGMSVGALLAHFFAYLEAFDWCGSSVAVHRTALLSKEARWGAKRKAWRMSIEDPFELDRDLGVVLQLPGQQRILDEISRAVRLLVGQGASFEALVEPAEKAATKKEKKEMEKAARQEKRKQKNTKSNPKAAADTKATYEGKAASDSTAGNEKALGDAAAKKSRRNRKLKAVPSTTPLPALVAASSTTPPPAPVAAPNVVAASTPVLSGSGPSKPKKARRGKKPPATA